MTTGVAPDVLDAVRGQLVRAGGEVSPERVDSALRASGIVLGRAARADLDAAVRAELLGAGPLQPFLDDPEVTDVVVNGPRDVWVERGGRLVRVEVDLGDVDQVRALAVRLAAAGGQRLDDAQPTADARLPDGTRLHAVVPPVADGCTLLSLRVVRHRPFTLDELVRAGAVAPGLDEVLRGLVEQRANLVLSGATGTGKTTLLSSLLSLADPAERLVCIEESGELAPRHPHVVRLLVRRPNVEGAGAVGLTDLVRQSLRMRPDRIVLGECRGAEVAEVLSALNTGHEGGCTTLHANTATDVPARLEALAALAGMAPEALAAQAVSAVHAIVHLRRNGGRRHVAEIGVVRRLSGQLEVQPALLVVGGDRLVQGPGWPALSRRLGDA
ncbi:MAG TPA: TadA family conjugal transfer-associated ATPase [Cellulomonas sp.]